MVMLPEVPFSELINRPKATREKLARSRAHGLRLRSRDANDLILREEETDRKWADMVNVAARVLAELMANDEYQVVAMSIATRVFPWIRFLPEEDERQFLRELSETLRATIDLDNHEPVHQLIISWKATAEIHADPELLAVAQRGSEEHGDFGPVPSPPGTGLWARSEGTA